MLAHVGVTASVVLQSRPIIWPLHNDTVHRDGPGADFYAVYHAGVQMREGRSPYLREGDSETPYYYAFRYLPAVGLAAQPFTALPPRGAHAVWILLLELLLLALVLALARHLSDPLTWLATTVLLLLSSPFFLELYMGQFTFAVVTLCVLAFLSDRRWTGRLLYPLSVALKPLTLVVVPALVRHRRDWPMGLLALVVLLAASVPYFVAVPEDAARFFNANFDTTGGFHSGNYGFGMLTHLLAEDFGLGDVEDVLEAFRVVVLVLTALLVIFSKARSRTLGVSALLAAHFVTYQHVWEHHMSAVLVIGAFMLTAEMGRGPRLTILLAMLLLALPTPYALFDTARNPSVYDPAAGADWPRAASYFVLLPKVLPTLAIYGVGVGLLGRAGLDGPRVVLRDLSGRMVTDG